MTINCILNVLCGKVHCHGVISTSLPKHLVFSDECAAENVPELEVGMLG
jgi:hypothetical protein